jgi:AP endonuclease 2
MPDIPGSDHCPVYADFHDSITLADGTKLDLWKEMNPNRQPEADPPDPPKFAARFFDEFSGRQKLLSNFFAKRPPGGVEASFQSTASSIESLEPTLEDARKALLSAAEHGDDNIALNPACEPSLEDARSPMDTGSEPCSYVSTPSNSAEPKISSSEQPVPRVDLASARPSLSRSQPSSTSEQQSYQSQSLKRTSSNSKSSKTKGKQKLVRGQQTLATFMKRSAGQPKEAKGDSPARRTTDNVLTKRDQDYSASESADVDLGTNFEDTISQAAPSPSPPSDILEMTSFAVEDFQPNFNTASTSAAWSSLLTPKAVPRCIAHGEPAKEWTVNKPGPNKGRKFWLCSRGIGSKGDPEARFVLTASLFLTLESQ